MAIVINGKQMADENFSKLAKQYSLKNLKSCYLGIVQVGDDNATNIYVNSKIRLGEKLGLRVDRFSFKQNAKKEDLELKISQLNKDKNCIGIMVQSPLPISLDLNEITEYINPAKDVDCMTSINLGKISKQSKPLLPATVRAVVKIFELVAKEENLNVKEYLKFSNIVIINSSLILGKPLSAYLTNLNATVSICNKYTKEMDKLTKQADILISATGVVNLINADIVKKDSLIIDCGMNKINEKLYGDVDFDRVSKKVKYITPVPGGVGPLTVVSLFENQLDLLNAK